jgi:hypothetical protein
MISIDNGSKCGCATGTIMQNGSCTKTCPSGQELVNDTCVNTCIADQIRVSGVCACKAGMTLLDSGCAAECLTG